MDTLSSQDSGVSSQTLCRLLPVSLQRGAGACRGTTCPLYWRQWFRADAYVVAVPTYLFGAHSSLKGLLDRGLTFSGHVDSLWGKPAVGVVLAGIPGLEGYTKLMVDSFIKFSLADHRGSEIVYAALPGEVFFSDQGKQTAKRLAQALTGEVSTHDADPLVPRCPLCGGDTFRFLKNGSVRCMVCSSEGTYEWDNEGLRLTTHRGDHVIFLSYEDVTNHFAFLRGMKDKFVAKRKELKAVVQGYADIGEWDTPQEGLKAPRTGRWGRRQHVRSTGLIRRSRCLEALAFKWRW